MCGCRFLTHILYDLLILRGELLHEVVLSKGGRGPEFRFLGYSFVSQEALSQPKCKPCVTFGTVLFGRVLGESSSDSSNLH